LGLLDKAWEFWEKSSLNDLDLAGGGAAEGVHIAGAGINWQMVVLGFAGMKTALASPQFSLAPRLPERWKRLAFPINWKGQELYVEITHDRICITNHSAQELQALIYEQSVRIPGWACKERTYSKERTEHEFDPIL